MRDRDGDGTEDGAAGARVVKVDSGEGEQRLDRWLRRKFPELDLGQARIEKMCRKGEIRVDGGRVKPATRVLAGQSVRVPPMRPADTGSALPARDGALATGASGTIVAQPPRGPSGKPKPIVSDEDAEMIRSCVIFRDDCLVVLNKPHGLPSQGGTGQKRHVDGLAEALRFGARDRPRLVHRLDRDTSGVLILARTRQIAARLGEAIRDRETRKVYWAVVAGVPRPFKGEISFGLTKARGRGSGSSGEGEKMRCVHPRDVERTEGAKRALTRYATLFRVAGRAAWVAMEPVTGRTHQLRAHMAGIGHPIAGDGKYGGSSQENPGDGWGARLGGDISRKLHLHSRTMSFRHPETGAPLEISAPLPPHMAETFASFGWSEDLAESDPFAELRARDTSGTSGRKGPRR